MIKKLAILSALLFSIHSPAHAKCQTYGYQTICDSASEYRNAPLPSAASQDPFSGRTQNQKLNHLGSKIENDEQIQNCNRLGFSESMICLARLKAERSRERERQVIEGGGSVTKCEQVGNTMTCYTR